MRVTRVAGVVLFATLAGCWGAPPDDDEPLGQSTAPLTAYCEANVKGVGMVATEDKYLPNVVHCENGGAPFEALKAQAIVARTYLYYKMETSGAIADGTGDQVYSCGSGPTAEQIKAVKETAGQVLRYKGTTICAFFVAGGAASPPGCVGSTSASTEKYVTYNEGKSGSGITQSSLGWVSPTNLRNRGCLSQLGSRCLDNAGKNADDIVHFYYGADIVLETATGACVPTTTPDAGPADTGSPVVDSSAPADTAVKDSAAAVDSREDDAVDDSAAPAPTPASDRLDDSDLAGSCGCSTPGQAHDRASLAVAVVALFIARRRRVRSAR